MRAIYPDLPIVLATGHNTQELRAQFGAQNALAFASKPYSADALLNALSSLGVGRREG